MFNIFIAVTFSLGFVLFVVSFLTSFHSKTKKQAKYAVDWTGAGLFIMVISTLAFIANLLIGAL